MRRLQDSYRRTASPIPFHPLGAGEDGEREGKLAGRKGPDWTSTSNIPITGSCPHRDQQKGKGL